MACLFYFASLGKILWKCDVMSCHWQPSDASFKYFNCLYRSGLKYVLVSLPCPFQQNLVPSLTLYLSSSTKLFKLKNQSLVSGQLQKNMLPKPEPVIWSHDTGQWVACIDSCQLTITWMPKTKVVLIMVLL